MEGHQWPPGPPGHGAPGPPGQAHPAAQQHLLGEQLHGLSLQGGAAHHYPAVPQPAPGAGGQGYPPAAPGGAGYPPAAAGYPPAAAGYPPAAAGYPPAAAGYPPGAAGYPPAAIGGAGYPPGAAGYPPGAAGYPPGAAGGAGYPPGAAAGGAGYPPAAAPTPLYPPPAPNGVPSAQGVASGAGWGAPPGAAAAGPPPRPSAGAQPPPPAQSGAGAAAAGGGPGGAGWGPQSVQPAPAANLSQPGFGGHYGHLQYAPSFNTPAAAGQAAAAAVAAADSATQAAGALPAAQLVGPHLRLQSYCPATGAYSVSALVVAHPALASSTVQLHYGVNAPATQPAGPGLVLDDFKGYKFWRFDIKLQLSDTPGICNYLVGLVGGQAPLASHCFHLPARGEPWRWLFYSCNGFHEDEPERKYGGISNLWLDLMRRHEQARFHLQVGGGDQIYCDQVFHLPSLKPWLSVDDPHVRAQEPFTPQMLADVESFYFRHYAAHFAEPAFAQALASIPFVFSWDDHDIFDGWGSYPDYLQRSAVFQGMFAVARRFYLLFQHHCRYDNAAAISSTLGDFSYHQVRWIGPNALLLAPDTRSERTIHQVLPPQAWDLLLGEVGRRLAERPGAAQHLLVMLPVPIVYPKVPVTESMLSSISGAMARSKPMREAIGKLSGASGAVSVFNEPDLLDDLLDHWTSTDHLAEREMLVRRLQAIAQAHSVRVTFLSGDVHVGAFGCFQAHPKQHVRVLDPKFMLQVISSAIGNEPPPAGVVSLLESTSMATTVMGDTLDKMVRTFPDRKKLRGARNYCEVVTLAAAHSCSATGALQPPGGLAFVLRFETGPPGRPTGVETFTQVAPVLLAGPRAAEGAQFAAGPGAVQASGASGLMGQIASALPGDTGQQLQQGVKKVGHKLANFLARV